MALSMKRNRVLSLLFKKVKCRHALYRSIQHSVIQANEAGKTEDLYPPIKPKYPPGKWGSMDTKMAWILHEEGNKWKNTPTVKERLRYLETMYSEHGRKLWRYRALPDMPGLSAYQQDTTKTAIIPDAPEILKTIDIDIESEFKEIKNIFIEKLAEEHELIANQPLYLSKMQEDKVKLLNSKLIQSLVMTVVTALAQKHEHLMTGLVDPEVDISAFWERYGVRAFKPAPNKDKPFRLAIRFLQNYSSFQSESQITCQLRSKNPLPEFLPRDHKICTSEPYPQCRFWPAEMGAMTDWVKPKCDPGYVAKDPFQFVNLSFVVRNYWGHTLVQKKLGDENLPELLKYFGMNTAFISAVAQAYNQGFSTFVELTYPLTTQTVMTDGRQFSIYSYQLNTLHLWKDDEANPLRNICFLQEFTLFDTIENGKVKGFNDEAFKALMRCFVLKPVDRGYDLRPSIPKDSPDNQREHIPMFKEEIVVKKEIVYDEGD